MQVTNILFRLSSLLGLDCTHLNSQLQTILNFEDGLISLTHISTNKNIDTEDVGETLYDINNLFSAYLNNTEPIMNHLIGYSDSSYQTYLESFQNNFRISHINNVDEVNIKEFVKVDKDKLLALTQDLPSNLKFKSFEDLIEKLDNKQRDIYMPSLEGKKNRCDRTCRNRENNFSYLTCEKT